MSTKEDMLAEIAQGGRFARGLPWRGENFEFHLAGSCGLAVEQGRGPGVEIFAKKAQAEDGKQAASQTKSNLVSCHFEGRRVCCNARIIGTALA